MRQDGGRIELSPVVRKGEKQGMLAARLTGDPRWLQRQAQLRELCYIPVIHGGCNVIPSSVNCATLRRAVHAYRGWDGGGEWSCRRAPVVNWH
jgi:hypothetical protein